MYNGINFYFLGRPLPLDLVVVTAQSRPWSVDGGGGFVDEEEGRR